MKKLFLGVFLMFIFVTIGTTTASAAESDVPPDLPIFVAKINSEVKEFAVINPLDFPYVIAKGTVYYESSDNFGSGRSGIVNKKNKYITIPCYAGINGYSFLDKDGNILAHNYIEDENDIVIPKAPKDAVKLFKHFKSFFGDNGWVDANKVSKSISDPKPPNDKKRKKKEQKPKEQKPEDVVENIKDIQEKNEKTTIVVDFSGSMSDNQREVVELLETIDFDKNTTIIVFATKYEIVSKKQLISEDFDVGGATYMLKALNKAVSLGTEHLIVISDLDTQGKYDGISLKKSKTLKSVTVYDPDDGIEDTIIDDMFKVTWKNAKISRIRIK